MLDLMTFHLGSKTYLLLALVFAYCIQASPTALNILEKRDPFDLNVFASLGDSFCSGPSAGDVFSSPYPACRRYTQAEGPQIKNDTRFTGTKNFNFIGCSGARTAQIYTDQPNGPSGKPKTSQASQLQGLLSDFTTLSIGGNDIGFAKLLDRCVYRFYDFACTGCSGTSDCSSDCQAQIDATQALIDSPDFATGLSRSIQTIFQNAPQTRLYVHGYPHFFNAATTQCSSVSWTAWCSTSSNILKLTQDRRAKMNTLTDNLNNKIRAAVGGATVPGGHGSISFVDVNPAFENHRFCEPYVTEPSYRNPDIWFYPFEFWTGNTLSYVQSFDNSINCSSILANDGDWGNYYACEIAEGFNSNRPLGLVRLYSTPAGFSQDTVGTTGSSGSGSLPDFVARIFHPTINGFSAYKKAAYETYNTGAFASGRCSFHLNEFDTCEAQSSDLYAQLNMLDNNHAVIGNTPLDIGYPYGPPINAKDPYSFKTKLPYPLVIVGEHTGDYIQFNYNGLQWTSKSASADGSASCSTGGWDPRQDYCPPGPDKPVRKRQMDCSFPC